MGRTAPVVSRLSAPFFFAAKDRTMKNAPAFTVECLNLKETLATRAAAFATLNQSIERVRMARDGFADLERRAGELERKAQTLETQIARAGGAALAARALGFGGDDSAPEGADFAKQREEIDKAREELRRTRAAIEAAPALFPPLLAELDEARSAAFEAHLDVGRVAGEWVESARRIAADICKDADFVFARLVSLPPRALPTPGSFRALPGAKLDALLAECAAREEADEESSRLTAKVKTTEPAESWEDRHRRCESKNIAARQEFEAKRRAAEEAQSRARFNSGSHNASASR
jgi:hypothetical protein